ncbi:MAG TPA: family 10 glycosylhydrolase, partial [Chloroflexota bacterium]|nr:family 10 glycosylhydrolase [Chloroflexota bacterium]
GSPVPPPQAAPTETPGPVHSAPPQLRALWVDAFHDGIKSPAQVDALIKSARAAGANTLFVQVRRRGDAYYARTGEPRVEDPRLQRGFDALQAVIEKARSGSPPLEVHAWIATVALWKDKTVAPRDPAHALNAHGTQAPGDDNWLSLDDRGQAWDTENYMLDPGNPAAARYVASVAEELARNYDVDGIHLDLVRYAGVQWGYNPASLARYRRRYGLEESARPPAPTEALWQQWRRDQVTALVRRTYLDCVAITPRLKMTAAVIGWGNGPTDDASWRRTSAFGNVFQEWKRWLEEGIVDALLPMNYDDEANDEQRAWFDRWMAWEKGLLELPKKRQVIAGVGLFLNKVEAGLAQVRRALAAVNGVALYSYAVTNLPPKGSDDPEVPNETFFARLAAADGPFAGTAPVPAMPWKETPGAHVRGVASAGGAALDGATVRLEGPSRATAEADGNGYFGAVDLAPGTYAATLTHEGAVKWRGSVELPAGSVTTLDLAI